MPSTTDASSGTGLGRLVSGNFMPLFRPSATLVSVKGQEIPPSAGWTARRGQYVGTRSAPHRHFIDS
jgi:hypothetical protein